MVICPNDLNKSLALPVARSAGLVELVTLIAAFSYRGSALALDAYNEFMKAGNKENKREHRAAPLAMPPSVCSTPIRPARAALNAFRNSTSVPAVPQRACTRSAPSTSQTSVALRPRSPGALLTDAALVDGVSLPSAVGSAAAATAAPSHAETHAPVPGPAGMFTTTAFVKPQDDIRISIDPVSRDYHACHRDATNNPNSEGECVVEGSTDGVGLGGGVHEVRVQLGLTYSKAWQAFHGARGGVKPPTHSSRHAGSASALYSVTTGHGDATRPARGSQPNIAKLPGAEEAGAAVLQSIINPKRPMYRPSRFDLGF